MERMLTGNIKTESYEQLIDELMSTYGQDILQLVYAYVHNETVAEDLTQEIFVKCYKGLPKYRGRSSLKTWLWRIAINHAKDYLKSWYNQNVKITEDAILNRATLSSSVEQIVVQQDEDAALAAAVILQLNENTIKTRLRKGKLLLKNILEGSEWKND